jgi:hypothetical protein
MATWRAIRSSRSARKLDRQDSIEQALGRNGFTATSLGRARAPFRGAFSPLCTFLISLMNEGVVASLLGKRVYLQLAAKTTSKWLFFSGLPRGSLETVPGWSPGTLDAHISRLQSPIAMRSKAKL